MTQQPPAASTQAQLTIRSAFDRFSATVSTDDRRDFANTELRDVREAALQVERDLSARRSLRNLRRLQPFLQGLEHYSKTIEVLCNGTDYLPWLWAPVKLMLQVSADFLTAFEKLIEAYGKIANALPRFDRLSSALKHDHNFQAVLAFFYADILEFHRRAYKFVRKKAWKLLFTSLWGQFESRFGTILASLSYHGELVDKQAIAVNIFEATERRMLEQEQWDKEERTWRANKHRAVMSWLGIGGTPPEDSLDDLLDHYVPGSCDWFIKHAKTELWLNGSRANPLMWLHGKPGAGKSVICSNLVQFMEAQKLNVLYYFCSYLDQAPDNAARLLQHLTAQAVQIDPDVVAYIHDDYIPSHPTASRRALKELLPKLMQGVGSLRLVIDGIDEWDLKPQKFILEDIIPMFLAGTSFQCKVLISSRDVPPVSRVLRRITKATISLGDESISTNSAIESFVEKRLLDFQDRLDELDPSGASLPQLRRSIMEKSNGMFLWVRLVLDSLETIWIPQKLLDVVESLPSDLSDLYTRILERICNPRDTQTFDMVSRILKWICFSRRSLNKFELLHGLALTPDETVLDGNYIPIPGILELCKPLIEQRADSSVVFIHFSVQEFLLKSNSCTILQQSEANEEIALACATTLSYGLDLLDPDVTESERRVRVGSGIYRLLPYALEHWIEHFLLYASTGGNLEQSCRLPQHLTALRSKHDHLLHIVGSNHGETGLPRGAPSSEQLDDRLGLTTHLQVHGLIRDVLQTRWSLEQTRYENGHAAGEHARIIDRTLLSRLSAEFESLVLYLLSQSSITGLSADRLDAFKQTYASTAFRCRYMFCKNSSTGFVSSQMREQHEETHMRRVYCTNSACQWSRIGFENRKRLDAHVRKHHSKKPAFAIPPRVQRSVDAEVEQATVDEELSRSEASQAHNDSIALVPGSLMPRLNLTPPPPPFLSDSYGIEANIQPRQAQSQAQTHAHSQSEPRSRAVQLQVEQIEASIKRNRWREERNVFEGPIQMDSMEQDANSGSESGPHEWEWLK